MENLALDKETFLKKEIEKIIIHIKNLTDEGKIKFQASGKNTETIRGLKRSLGITEKDFKEEILEAIKQLKIEDYYQGPDEDYIQERGLIFWKFGIYIFKNQLYLKFHIDENESGERIILWSYHIPEHEIKYPFKVAR